MRMSSSPPLATSPRAASGPSLMTERSKPAHSLPSRPMMQTAPASASARSSAASRASIAANDRTFALPSSKRRTATPSSIVVVTGPLASAMRRDDKARRGSVRTPHRSTRWGPHWRDAQRDDDVPHRVGGHGARHHRRLRLGGGGEGRRAAPRVRPPRHRGHRHHRDRRRQRPRPAGRAPRTAPGRRPLAPPARLARSRSLPRHAGARAAVRDDPRARRASDAGHVAEHLPRRPQRRQPGPYGPPLVPPRLTSRSGSGDSPPRPTERLAQGPVVSARARTAATASSVSPRPSITRSTSPG